MIELLLTALLMLAVSVSGWLGYKFAQSSAENVELKKKALLERQSLEAFQRIIAKEKAVTDEQVKKIVSSTTLPELLDVYTQIFAPLSSKR